MERVKSPIRWELPTLFRILGLGALLFFTLARASEEQSESQGGKVKRWSSLQEISGWNALKDGEDQSGSNTGSIGSALPSIKVFTKKYSSLKRRKVPSAAPKVQTQIEEIKSTSYEQPPTQNSYANVVQSGYADQETNSPTSKPNSFTITSYSARNPESSQQESPGSGSGSDWAQQQSQSYYYYQPSEVQDTGREYIQGPGQVVDHEHPVYQAYQTSNRFQQTPDLTSKPGKSVQAADRDDLMSVDKSSVVFGLIFAWVFWILIISWYYSMSLPVPPGIHGAEVYPAKNGFFKKFILNIPMGGRPHWSTGRAIDYGASWDWAKVLQVIELAQEAYEKFDYQSLDCQKKAICELVQKQNDFGETGRKIGSQVTYIANASKKWVDLLEGLPMPQIIQTYLREYKEALNQGKSSTKDCSVFYPKCTFSIKEMFVKVQKKPTQLLLD